MKFLITGGAGFIGSAVIRYLANGLGHEVVNVDKLTYAGNLESLARIEDSLCLFEKVDICNQQEFERVLFQHKPDKVMNLAAESHVDRSIDEAKDFINTNIVGTYSVLEACRKYWNHLKSLNLEKYNNFRLHHVSTDEVYGDLDNNDAPFTEETAYSPSSPYAATKASSDHLIRAWNRTYDLPVVLTNCSNNYGPYQYPEKLIPLIILNALEGKKLPIYGDGLQVRDWLYVDDHAKALVNVILDGKNGETYNVGGRNEKKNIDVVMTVCNILDEMMPCNIGGVEKYSDLIEFVRDRPGHDSRYAINSRKIERELGWRPDETFESGIKKTVHWYLNNAEWCNSVSNKKERNKRLGLDFFNGK